MILLGSSALYGGVPEWAKDNCLSFAGVLAEPLGEAYKKCPGQTLGQPNKNLYYGGVPEWLKGTVLKTVKGEIPSRVRISPPPQD